MVKIPIAQERETLAQGGGAVVHKEGVGVQEQGATAEGGGTIAQERATTTQEGVLLLLPYQLILLVLLTPLPIVLEMVILSGLV